MVLEPLQPHNVHHHWRRRRMNGGSRRVYVSSLGMFFFSFFLFPYFTNDFYLASGWWLRSCSTLTEYHGISDTLRCGQRVINYRIEQLSHTSSNIPQYNLNILWNFKSTFFKVYYERSQEFRKTHGDMIVCWMFNFWLWLCLHSRDASKLAGE